MAKAARTLKDVSATRPITPQNLSPEDRQRMIAEAAYYLAEHRAFQGGDQTQDWLQAEQEIDRTLARSS
jgi:hypothetical protein